MFDEQDASTASDWQTAEDGVTKMGTLCRVPSVLGESGDVGLIGIQGFDVHGMQIARIGFETE